MSAANASASWSRIRVRPGRLAASTPSEYTSAARSDGTSRSAAMSSKNVGRESPASTWNCIARVLRHLHK
jgi:hypothetical protein